MAVWDFASWYRDQLGIFPALRELIRSRFSSQLVTLPNPVSGGRVFLRPGTADQSVYGDIFFAGEYNIEFNDPKIIVDAGAHIGLASAVFAGKYPDAQIIALEPEPANFRVLQENARLYSNIIPVPMGLWSKRALLKFQDEHADTWSFRVAESEGHGGVPALDLLSLMRDFDLERIDVLKIDIEGAEIEVLRHSQPWMHYVDTLVIELHDRFRPGCKEALEWALRDYQYFKKESGENLIFFELRKRVMLTAKRNTPQAENHPSLIGDEYTLRP